MLANIAEEKKAKDALSAAIKALEEAESAAKAATERLAAAKQAGANSLRT